MRAWYQDFKDHSRCLICGETDPNLLQYHHLDPRGKDDAVAHLVSQGRPIKRLIVELEKCICLCEHHHAAVHKLDSPDLLRCSGRDHTLDFFAIELVAAAEEELLADQQKPEEIMEDGLA